jgi:hypothetical protein
MSTPWKSPLVVIPEINVEYWCIRAHGSDRPFRATFVQQTDTMLPPGFSVGNFTYYEGDTGFSYDLIVPIWAVLSYRPVIEPGS